MDNLYPLPPSLASGSVVGRLWVKRRRSFGTLYAFAGCPCRDPLGCRPPHLASVVTPRLWRVRRLTHRENFLVAIATPEKNRAVFRRALFGSPATLRASGTKDRLARFVQGHDAACGVRHRTLALAKALARHKRIVFHLAKPPLRPQAKLARKAGTPRLRAMQRAIRRLHQTAPANLTLPRHGRSAFSHALPHRSRRAHSQTSIRHTTDTDAAADATNQKDYTLWRSLALFACLWYERGRSRIAARF